MKRRGFFITFEGPEGSGKSTHIRLLADYLRTKGRQILMTREPGGSHLAIHFRKILLEQGEGLTPMAELFLYEADRAQHVRDVIAPALRRGQIVLCDRFIDSTVAYQGFGRGLPRAAVASMNRLATDGLMPDLTILLDVPVERGLRLAHAKKKGHDRLEKAGLPFHRRVRRGFLSLAKREPRRFRLIAQQNKPEATQSLVRRVVERTFHL
jgi:dTMP kinase